jgi:hypothetical protein
VSLTQRHDVALSLRDGAVVLLHLTPGIVHTAECSETAASAPRMKAPAAGGEGSDTAREDLAVSGR